MERKTKDPRIKQPAIQHQVLYHINIEYVLQVMYLLQIPLSTFTLSDDQCSGAPRISIKEYDFTVPD
jgi:hypothetical protein